MKKIRKQYKEAFGSYQIPEALDKLVDFEEQYGAETYSEHFSLCTDLDKTPDMGQYSLDEEYFERLMVFAYADGDGGRYAFWAHEIGIPLEEAPIIVISSDGPVKVIAENIGQLIKLLSFGPAPIEGMFFRDADDFIEPENADTFRKWMTTTLNIQPIKNLQIAYNDEVNGIVDEAVKKYGNSFKEWMMTLNPQYESFDEYDE